MPVVNVDPDELRRLTGHEEKDDDELRTDLFDLGMEFEGWTEDDEFQLEFAPDRLDRLSVEGLARSLRYHYGDDRGVDVPTTNDAEWTIRVADPPAERPYITGAVVRGLDLDEPALESLIQLQEKLHATMGRDRRKGAIGVHDLTMLKGADGSEANGSEIDADAPAADTPNSVVYTGVDPDAETFVPLESDAELTPAEVCAEHPIGTEYADLVAELDRVPAIYDDLGLFSFPPVINGRRTEVSTDSRDLFIEMTGTDQWTIDRMLAIVCYALDARGGRVESVAVEYADGAPGEYAGHDLTRPDLATKTKTITHARTEQIVGESLDPDELVDCAERAGLDATETTDDDGERVYEVAIPPYRVDVLHPLDVIDDIGRAYGFNHLEPRYPDVSTVGGRHERSRLEDAVRDALVGLGFEDLLDFHMTNEAETFDRMGLDRPAGASSSDDAEVDPDALDPDSAAVAAGGTHTAEHPLGAAPPVTIREPYSEDYTILRTWALPSLAMVLENNTHREYPQDLAEIGLAAHVDPDAETGAAERRTVAAALARADASYEDAKGRLQALAGAFDADLATPPTEHPAFVDGRTATIELDGEPAGVIGELHPRVLVEHDLELPVAAFEFRLDALD